MCLGIPGQIVALFLGQNDLATVNISGVKCDINIALLENEIVKPGDWVLIHEGGSARSRAPEDPVWGTRIVDMLVGDPLPRIR